MQQKISVVPATMDDVAIIAPMFDAYRRFYKADSNLEDAIKFIRTRISKKESVIFIAFRQDKGKKIPAGFTQLYPSFSSVSMKRLWILNDLFVQPTCRKLGVGSRLMERAREFAKKDGAKGLSLATQTDNAPAQALYEKMGYKRDSQFFHFHLFF